MVGRRVIARIGRAVIGPFFAIVLILYFALNLIEGDHGLMAWLRRAHQVHDAEMTLAATDTALAHLRHRTDLLKGNQLDPDLLDERNRASLNTIGQNEIVIFAPTAESAPKSN
jgi:cell division protein FtsB